MGVFEIYLSAQKSQKKCARDHRRRYLTKKVQLQFNSLVFKGAKNRWPLFFFIKWNFFRTTLLITLQPLRWNYKTCLSSAPDINFVTLVLWFLPAAAGLCRNSGSSLSEASLQCFYLPAPLQGVWKPPPFYHLAGNSGLTSEDPFLQRLAS